MESTRARTGHNVGGGGNWNSGEFAAPATRF